MRVRRKFSLWVQFLLSLALCHQRWCHRGRAVFEPTVCVCVCVWLIAKVKQALTTWKEFSSFLRYLASPPVTAFTHAGRIADKWVGRDSWRGEKPYKISSCGIWRIYKQASDVLWSKRTNVITKLLRLCHGCSDKVKMIIITPTVRRADHLHTCCHYLWFASDTHTHRVFMSCWDI